MTARKLQGFGFFMAAVFLPALICCAPRTAEVAARAEGRPSNVGKDSAAAVGKAGTESSSSASPIAGTDIKDWLKAYPAEAASWQASEKMTASPSGYGGSIQKERSLAQPEYKTNYKGSAFALSFQTPRGHVYTWKEITSTKRVNDKTSASCLTCKTPDVASWYKEGSWAYAQRTAQSYFGEEHPAVNCFSCHDPESGGLRITVPSFTEAMKRQGIDLSKASSKEMESYVCAQCHSTYYFEPKTNRVVSPWDKGLAPDAMLAYYATKPSGFEQDFEQPDSKVKVLKARHPDYEVYSSGIHASAGVSCADCHMPVQPTGDGKKVRDHNIGSPLLTVNDSCLACHKDRSGDWLKARVSYIQSSVFETQRLAGLRIESTHKAIAAAAAAGLSPAKLEKARADLRTAQWYWDYIASSNSMGFHNPELAMKTLAKAIDSAAMAEEDLRP